MSTLNAPASVNFATSQSVPQHFKSFTNYMNEQTKMHADKVFARYYSQNGFKTLTYADVDRLATNLACKWAYAVQDVDVVSFISDHNMCYLIVMLALLKLRIPMFTISPRNSEAAVINLLKKTESKLLIIEAKYESIGNAAAAQVADVNLMVISPLDIDHLVKQPLNPNFQEFLDFDFSDKDINKTAIICHSSGTTSFPKPVKFSNNYIFYAINAFEILVNANDELDSLTDEDVILPIAPLFHTFGLFTIFSVTTFGGSIVFLEKLPATQKEIFRAFQDNNVTMFAAPPIVYEQMAHHLKQTNDFIAAQQLKYAITGGAALKYETFEWFHGNCINVRSMYGSTESNTIMACDLDHRSKNYGSLRLFQRDSQGQAYGSFEVNDESEPNIKHLYIHAGSPFLGSHVANRADGGYSTQDLFIESSDFPGYYKYIGRRDDTLVMENGEKTNPVPMEATIRQSPMVEQAAVIGHGRQCTAALIQLNVELAKYSSDEEIHKAVYDAVKKANNECPNHSKIFPQMVKILSLDHELPTTAKGTIMRKKAELTYQDAVEKLYKDFLERSRSHVYTSVDYDTSAWTAQQTEDFLIDSAAEVLDIPSSIIRDHPKSLFHLGLNSINAIQLRNRICAYFDDVAPNFIYQHYSIKSMCNTLMSNKREDIQEQTEMRYQQTQTLAESYIKRAKRDFPRASNQYTKSKLKVVLLTGATGSVGSSILRELLQDPTIEKVYCCVRGEDYELKNRLVEAITSRSLDASLLETDRVEVLPMRFHEPLLGLSEEHYHQLKKEVTIVQHCAWLLNFNMTIDHFDKECIQPFYNLLKFAYNEINPMHVHFISSISASALLGNEIAEEPLPLDSYVAMPLGYSQSKFVVETLLNYLTAEKNFPCYIERLGQVCGDSINGVWNVSEQYPLMFIGGGSIMKKMPRLNTEIDWIPSNFAAAAIADIMSKTSHLPANTSESIYHIVNPRLIPWYGVLTAMRKSGMDFDIVEPAIWAEELAKDDTNPAFRLMSFYEVNFKGSFRMAVWKTEKTRALAPILSQSPVLDINLFRKYLKHWELVGFYKPSH
ncbi:hypothetical protein PS15p_208343 [Mucor circinelloides]